MSTEGTLLQALKNLLREAERSGMADNLIADIFPETKMRNGENLPDCVKDARRAMNEARAAIKLAEGNKS